MVQALSCPGFLSDCHSNRLLRCVVRHPFPLPREPWRWRWLYVIRVPGYVELEGNAGCAR